MRVVLVLADGVSWHDYPDSALLGAGASALQKSRSRSCATEAYTVEVGLS